MLSATLKLKLKRDLQAPSIARAAASGCCDELKLSASVCHTLMLPRLGGREQCRPTLPRSSR